MNILKFVYYTIAIPFVVILNGVQSHGHECGQSFYDKSFSIIQPDHINEIEWCSYHIYPNNPNICQIRIDFDEFNLTQPLIIDNYNTCNRGYMTISLSSNKNDNKGIEFCGENTGQHIYLPFDGSEPNENIRFDFITYNPDSPTWNLHVRQLECTGTKSVTDGDQDLISPIGCLQYYPESSGSFESFNFRNGQGPYLPNQNYAICFKRTIRSRGLRFKTDFFQMAEHLDFVGPQINSNCLSTYISPKRNEDYFHVPNSEYFGSFGYMRASRFCGNSLEDGFVITKGMGPYVVYVNTDGKLHPNDLEREIGFRFSYNILENDTDYT